MRSLVALVVSSVCLLLVGCGPSERQEGCTGEACNSGACEAGQVRECYTGKEETIGVGPCVVGEQRCTAAGQWGNCTGEVKPVGEVCGDGVDQNCNGAVDENEDRDGDGFTTCDGDCCDSTECGMPNLANPSAFDATGNNVDDDCDGTIDNTALLCDQGITSSTTNAKDFARAIDICQEATLSDKKWGVISAKLSLPSGMGVPEPVAHAVRPKFGTKVFPRGGLNMAVLSSGTAGSPGDTAPTYEAEYNGDLTSPFPMDWVTANGGTLPNATGCPEPDGLVANDPVMLTLEVRVPSNARSFALKTNFYSVEFPEYTCSEFNDFFVVLLDSMYTGNPTNPMDKNLAFFTAPDMKNYPVGVNLAHGNTGLFTQCMNGSTGCSGNAGTIMTCTGTDDLAGTGLDTPEPDNCDANSLRGGGTGWLTTRGNVVPGEIIKLRIAIWDTSDNALDSTALIDGFEWSVEATQAGTVILREEQTNPFESPAAKQLLSIK